MRSVYTLLILAIVALTVAGCTGGTGNNPVSTPFVGGQTALELSFVEQQPPVSVFDDGQFPFGVAVNIVNRGEYDLESDDGYIEIDSIDAETFGVRDNDLIEDLPEIRGTRKNLDGSITEGLRDVVTFDNLNYQTDLVGDLPQTVRISSCYNYETKVSANLCIKEEAIDGISDNEVCEIAGQKLTQNSGAPIHITQLTESSKGRDGIQVTFTIEHVGTPQSLFYRDDVECIPRINNPDRDLVYLEIDPIVSGSIRAECSGFQEGSGDSGYVKIFQGLPRSVTCSFDTSRVTNDFIEPLSITMRYRYQQFIEREVLVKDVSTE